MSSRGGRPVCQLRWMAAQRARMRAVIRVSSPAGVRSVVVLERELLFERVDDRLDPLADEAERRRGPLGLVGAAGADNQRAQLAGGVFEVAAGEAFVAEDELAVQRLAGEQREPGLAFWRVGGDEVEVDDCAVGAAEQDEPHPPKEARVRGAVTEAAPGRELAAVRRQSALPARQRGGVEQQQCVVEAGQLAGDRPPERDQFRRQLPAPLVIGRLRGQPREQVAQPPASDRQEASLAADPEQRLRDHQADQLVVGDQLRPTAPTTRLGRRRKQRTGSAIDCDQEGVEIGAHVGLQVDGASATPTFDTLALTPYTRITATAVNYRSSI